MKLGYFRKDGITEAIKMTLMQSCQEQQSRESHISLHKTRCMPDQRITRAAAHVLQKGSRIPECPIGILIPEDTTESCPTYQVPRELPQNAVFREATRFSSVDTVSESIPGGRSGSSRVSTLSAFKFAGGRWKKRAYICIPWSRRARAARTADVVAACVPAKATGPRIRSSRAGKSGEEKKKKNVEKKDEGGGGEGGRNEEPHRQ